ncbi:hypothetical protein A3A84_00830 [Candidatus Collierbacteria bacterium RIFCSPLOWO2_01_FULL_50_23]|uniref:Uncharacterized protein n=2 Tax=Candidatus Collieribacteriota TaxID=1752725 RepID=A0A1F5EUA1_9BACT|nr:MAG: hypothetical protein A3D09_00985 [Candidatus Collierbacteria bacterium RIFCSPHIGHO2_02_FULL_49_10]OGD71081.1 MAG: hypothetical protein A2703_01430 [Candidatus Collierbacteria bacterium RIFCSPHIGHO2_01_FULL_50_25]OGD74706.1 MAG: hypothetical protein A3A84_00830 [Candidatus Collierbacteria bacterium RIFCSPLOWO2_01_FULL_50_23]
MQIRTVTLLAVSALLLGACSYTGPAATTTSSQTTPPAAITTAPTSGSTNLNDLNAELNATIDDGGQTDLNQLQKDASGL